MLDIFSNDSILMRSHTIDFFAMQSQRKDASPSRDWVRTNYGVRHFEGISDVLWVAAWRRDREPSFVCGAFENGLGESCG